MLTRNYTDLDDRAAAREASEKSTWQSGSDALCRGKP
jgi:hypothetical protein